MPVILAKREVKVGESQSEPNLGKNMRGYLKNSLKQKAFKWWSICLASIRP
jgi:hypothetical protein